jgi:hypothetical protein
MRARILIVMMMMITDEALFVVFLHSKPASVRRESRKFPDCSSSVQQSSSSGT